MTHYTWLRVPKKYWWFVFQLFLYCILVLSDFVVCYINSDITPVWTWISLIWGGALTLQGVAYKVVQLVDPCPTKPREKERKLQALMTRLSPLNLKNTTITTTSPPFSDYNSFSSSTLSTTSSVSQRSFQSTEIISEEPGISDPGISDGSAGWMVGGGGVEYGGGNVLDIGEEWERLFVTVENPIYSPFPMLRSLREDQRGLMVSHVPPVPAQRVYTIEVTENSSKVSVGT